MIRDFASRDLDRLFAAVDADIHVDEMLSWRYYIGEIQQLVGPGSEFQIPKFDSRN